MPIISSIGRRSWKVRLLIGTIYFLLLAGAVTMVYPFLLMIAGSTKSAVDGPDPAVIPPFLVDERALYQKFAEGLFNESLEAMRFAYQSDVPSFRHLEMPPPPRRELVDAWQEFLAATALPHYVSVLGFLHTPLSRNAQPHELRGFKAELIREFDGDVSRMNRALGSDFVNWTTLYVLPDTTLMPRQRPADTLFHQRYYDFKLRQPLASRYFPSVEGYFKIQFLQNRYGKEIAGYNRTHDTDYASWGEVHLDHRLPIGGGRTPAERADWSMFVRSLLNLFWVRADPEAGPSYQAFLQAKYRDLAAVNRNYGTSYAAFTEIPIVAEPPALGLVRSDWDAFVEGWKDPETGDLHQIAIEHLRIHSAEFQFRDFLEEQHGSIAAANRAFGTTFSGWLDVLPPQQDVHFLDFQAKRGWLRWEFVRRNYLSVIDYVVLHGRAVINTAIYCGLLIGVSLIVNPLGAYALSRYRPPSAYKVLLFLMLTMAFPPMVTQIPVFLMMRQFHLLNTFWALILPGIANGYAIFLLKGFFDSLPQELYESAQLDGAGEFRIFWQITMSLSKPILAVIALNAFTQAYSNFMYALLICQDERMWTLMPWLYQLQQSSAQGVIFASLLIASVPTFLLFLFCQKIIMRGIVVPVEK